MYLFISAENSILNIVFRVFQFLVILENVGQRKTKAWSLENSNENVGYFQKIFFAFIFQKTTWLILIIALPYFKLYEKFTNFLCTKYKKMLFSTHFQGYHQTQENKTIFYKDDLNND